MHLRKLETWATVGSNGFQWAYFSASPCSWDRFCMALAPAACNSLCVLHKRSKHLSHRPDFASAVEGCNRPFAFGPDSSDEVKQLAELALGACCIALSTTSLSKILQNKNAKPSPTNSPPSLHPLCPRSGRTGTDQRVVSWLQLHLPKILR